MSTQPTLNSIATDVVGHYSHAAKNLLAAYRTGAQRVGGRFSGRQGFGSHPRRHYDPE